MSPTCPMMWATTSRPSDSRPRLRWRRSPAWRHRGYTRLPCGRRSASAGRETAGVLHVPLGGLDLLIRRKPGVPAVSLGYYVPRSMAESPSVAGIGALAMRSIVRGAGDLDASALAFAAEGLGGTLSSSAGLDWSGVSLPVLSEHLATAASLIRLATFEPAFREEDVLTERGLLLEEAQQVADDMFRFPFLLAFGAAFSDRGYGRPVGGTPETLPRIDIEAVRAWHRDQHRLATRRAGCRGRPRSRIRSRGPGRRVRPTCHRRAPARLRARSRWIPAEDWQRVVTRAKAQTAFAMVFPGPDRRDPRRHAAEVWGAVASGLGGRLFDALRDRRSLAYTVVGTGWARRDGGAVLTYIATSPERETEARAAMLDGARAGSRRIASATRSCQAA